MCYEHKSNITKIIANNGSDLLLHTIKCLNAICYRILNNLFFCRFSLSLFLFVSQFLWVLFMSVCGILRVNHICAWCCLPNTKFQTELRLLCHRRCVIWFHDCWDDQSKRTQEMFCYRCQNKIFGYFQRLHFYLSLVFCPFLPRFRSFFLTSTEWSSVYSSSAAAKIHKMVFLTLVCHLAFSRSHSVEKKVIYFK